jgi:mono/diheme cytochrome c family protein
MRPTTSVQRLALLLALSASFAVGCRGQVSTRPPMHPNWNMDQQDRYDPQEPSPFFEDGRSARQPVPGTVPTGWMLESDEATEHLFEGTVGGVVVNALPDEIVFDRELIERGRDRYNIFCQPCHGLGGAGDGIIVERGMLQPPSFHEERLRGEPLGHIFRVITHGVSAGTVAVDGGGNMASYASQVPPRDRWAIATYIRALQTTTLASAAGAGN